MHIHFDFLEQSLKNASPLIAAWAKQHHIALFDFDHYLFSDIEQTVLEEHMQWVADNHSSMAVVELHPFFFEDLRHSEKTKLIQHYANRLNLPVMYWTADYRLWDSSPTSNRTFFPGWYLLLRKHAQDAEYRNYKFPEYKKYNFSCCNMANLRFEKVFNYIECFRRKRSDWYITIYDHPTAAISQINIRDVGPMPPEHYDLWNREIKPQIKLYVLDLQNNENGSSLSTIFEGHTNAYCNLVMEHSIEIEVVSEKSFKPFIAGQIPVYCARAGAAKFISTLGFDLFYDFIDHDRYDAIQGPITQGQYEVMMNRISAVHGEIDKLYTTDFAEYFHRPDILARLERNKEHFYSDAIDLMTIGHLDKLLDYIKHTP